MSVLWWFPSVLIPMLLIVGAGGAYVRLLSPETGFALYGAGLLLAALATPAYAGGAALASATGKPWRPQALRASVVPLLTVLALLLPNLPRLEPPIHDITTDPGDSLQFPPDVASRPNSAALQAMPREQVLELQREHYPDVAPLGLEAEPARSFSAALAAANRMPGWEIGLRDPGRGLIQATVTTSIFHFVDDVVIQVEPAPEEARGSRVQMRSRSRFGQSDLGANADRIDAYFARLREELSAEK